MRWNGFVGRQRSKSIVKHFLAPSAAPIRAKSAKIEPAKPVRISDARAPDAKPQTPSTRSSLTHLQVHRPHPVSIPRERVHAAERRRLEGPAVRVFDRRRVAIMERVRLLVVLLL